MTDSLHERVIAALGDHYALDSEIGRGGMSVVYRARDIRLNRTVAIKVLPPELAYDPAVRTRFTREAQTSAQLSHAHIVPIYDVGDREGIAYFVMAFVPGRNLATHLAHEPRQPIEEVRRILREIADAHVAGAGSRRTRGGRPQRHLLARRRRLSDAHGATSVHRRQLHGAAAQARERATARDRGSSTGCAARAAGSDRAFSDEDAGRSLAHGGGAARCAGIRRSGEPGLARGSPRAGSLHVSSARLDGRAAPCRFC